MKIFQARIIINAPAHIVWQALMNVEAYPKLDPHCIRIDGQIFYKAHLTIYCKPELRKTYRAIVSKLDENSHMEWLSSWPGKLWQNQRSFTVIAKDDQTTEFKILERFDGYLFNLFAHTIPNLTLALGQFANRLKKTVEERP